MTIIYAVVWTILAAWYAASQGCLAFNLASVIFVVAAYALSQSVAAMRRIVPCILLFIGLMPVAGLLQTGATVIALCLRLILIAIKSVF